MDKCVQLFLEGPVKTKIRRGLCRGCAEVSGAAASGRTIYAGIRPNAGVGQRATALERPCLMRKRPLALGLHALDFLVNEGRFQFDEERCWLAQGLSLSLIHI